MILQPAIVDLPPIQQNSAYEIQFRLTDRLRDTLVNTATDTFSSTCHRIAAGTKVVVLGKGPFAVPPCGLEFNQIYYVIASGLTENEFKLSATLNGASIAINGESDPDGYFVAVPQDITNFTIDADICQPSVNTRIQVATFSCTAVDAATGAISLKLSPTTSVAIPVGDYDYDVRLTPPNGDAFFALKGRVPVQLTRSRT